MTNPGKLKGGYAALLQAYLLRDLQEEGREALFSRAFLLYVQRLITAIPLDKRGSVEALLLTAFFEHQGNMRAAIHSIAEELARMYSADEHCAQLGAMHAQLAEFRVVFEELLNKMDVK